MKPHRPRIVTPDQIAAVLATCEPTPTGIRDRAMYLLMYRTGLRIGETLYLRLTDIDRGKAQLEVPPEGKTGWRSVPLPDSPNLDAALEAWESVRSAWPDSPFYFCTSSGRKVHENTARAVLLRRGKRAGLPLRITPHMMRHSFASELVRDGYPITVIQQLLGHSSPNTTLVYLHAFGQEHLELGRARQCE